MALVLALIAVLPAADWPQWRGSNHDGRSGEELPARLPDELPVAWKRKVGTGFSTVSVQGNHVLTMGNASETDTVWCLDAETGEVRWKHDYACALDPLYFEGGPCATPTVAEDRVYTLSRKGHAFCFDLKSGAVLWSRDLVEDHHLELPEWSFSSSAVLHGDLVLFNAGGDGIALRRGTGATAWISNPKPGGYASAVPFRSGHLLFTFAELIGLDPRSGTVGWRIDWDTGRGVNAADPILLDTERFLLSSALGSAVFQAGSEGPPREVWRNRNLRCYFNPGVLIDGCLYALDGTTHKPTELICLDVETGEEIWAEPGFATGGLVAAGNRLILFDRGELTIFPASREGFRPALRQQILAGKCWTAPVWSNGRIYCRNAAGDLACVRVSVTPASRR